MLKFYNTLTRKKENFRPRRNKKVEMFVCGPTVYDFTHLGHSRTYIFYDTLVHYLKIKGYKVFYLQNITDIDDKIIKRAKERNVSWRNIARTYEREYLKDIKSLGIRTVNKYARATDYIKEIISQVKRLLDKGYAYQIKDGIYYDIKKFKDYGKLSRRTWQQAEDATSRIDDSSKKRNKGDFCLWKFSKPGEPKWKSPWGFGRPGWHIEDTAIAEKYFGFQYDIHGGAIELSFPHHEAEIAQMEGISGKKPMVKYWIHSGLLKINGRKMSKSLGNFITIRDFLKKYPPSILRFIVFSAHYRSPLDYSSKIATEAAKNLEEIEVFLARLKKIRLKSKAKNKRLIKDFEKEFFSALDDDFNTPKAKAVLFDFIKEIEGKMDKKEISQTEAREIIKLFKKINKIFNFLSFEKVPKGIKELVRKRTLLRKKKEWKKADEIRERIERKGYIVSDTIDGTVVVKKIIKEEKAS